ncbi:MAG: XRE family transcriptional regulator [Desulfurellales bacterium]|nr:MAG: XRE family transcriptional regulator [Desulfurellales bacterium]
MENVKFKGDFIRQRRKELGLSQTQLGQEIGVSFRTISDIEKGKFGTRINRVPKLAKALKASVEDVCELPDYISLSIS